MFTTVKMNLLVLFPCMFVFLLGDGLPTDCCFTVKKLPFKATGSEEFELVGACDCLGRCEPTLGVAKPILRAHPSVSNGA